MEQADKRKWKVLSSDYLFNRPWLTVRRESVQLPNGNINSEYYVLEYPEWVNVLAITKEHEFVFIRQYRHGIGDTYYELCAGVCEADDDSPLQSAQRELLEETGYGGGHWKEYMVISANPGSQTNLTHCFLATDVEKISDQQLEDTEDLTIHLLSLDEVKQLLFDDQIKQSLHAAPLWKYMAENKLV
ncbi:NUDIX hydrolase [Bacteroides sp. OttesenSCG-928-D19]|nr:NUDIX hydrolase [Bacteroides sp. OttesenSCG-928-D19]